MTRQPGKWAERSAGRADSSDYTYGSLCTHVCFDPFQDILCFGPCSAGGVIVTSMDNKIVCDNTLDARLNLVMQECLPQLRKVLFPPTKSA